MNVYEPHNRRGPGLMLLDIDRIRRHGGDVGEAIARHGLFATRSGSLRPVPGTPGDESTSESSSSSSRSSESESESESAVPLPPKTKKKKSKAKVSAKEIAHALAALANARRVRSRIFASVRTRPAADLDESESDEPAPDAAIAAKFGLDDAAMARGKARDRLEAAIRSDDERALRILAARGLDRQQAKAMARFAGVSLSQMVKVHGDAERRAKAKSMGHAAPDGSFAFGRPHQKSSSKAYGGAA